MGCYLTTPNTDKVVESGAACGMAFGACNVQGWRRNQEDAHIVALDFDSAQMLGSIVANTGSLRSLDISCNVFAEDAGRILREGLCGVPANASACVGECCRSTEPWGPNVPKVYA